MALGGGGTTNRNPGSNFSSGGLTGAREARPRRTPTDQFGGARAGSDIGFDGQRTDVGLSFSGSPSTTTTGGGSTGGDRFGRRDSGFDQTTGQDTTDRQQTTTTAATQPSGPSPQELRSQALDLRGQRIGSASDRLRDAFRRETARRGLDTEEFLPLLEQRISEITGNLPDFAGSGPDDVRNFDQFFNTGIAPDVLDTRQSQLRNQFLNQLDDRFGSGFELEAVPGSFDDAAIEQVLDQAYQEALQGVERSRSRGQLTDSGFNRAVEELGTQRQGGATDLDAAGQSIIEDIRNQLSELATGARAGASSFRLGQDFDPNRFFNEFETITGSPTADIAARLRSAVPASSIFNPGEAITVGGSRQGLVNPGRNSLIGALSNRAAGDRNQQRGVGNVGVF